MPLETCEESLSVAAEVLNEFYSRIWPRSAESTRPSECKVPSTYLCLVRAHMQEAFNQVITDLSGKARAAADALSQILTETAPFFNSLLLGVGAFDGTRVQQSILTHLRTTALPVTKLLGYLTKPLCQVVDQSKHALATAYDAAAARLLNDLAALESTAASSATWLEQHFPDGACSCFLSFGVGGGTLELVCPRCRTPFSWPSASNLPGILQNGGNIKQLLTAAEVLEEYTWANFDDHLAEEAATASLMMQVLDSRAELLLHLSTRVPT
eukprot:TRINITY_DN13496_c0_g1_i3.p1 TRINITY_DN13496_c0_g1~~TRINITY_DN13496_c0_g1_i3.p1  ORF type:complete len:269 (-),score=38.07 TRINITY_DN13496_c0_g1_i3:1625-2431(-)